VEVVVLLVVVVLVVIVVVVVVVVEVVAVVVTVVDEVEVVVLARVVVVSLSSSSALTQHRCLGFFLQLIMLHTAFGSNFLLTPTIFCRTRLTLLLCLIGEYIGFLGVGFLAN